MLYTQVALLCIIVRNSTMTVDNMRGFSAIFASQAQALKKERRKTEDLLTEMLPRSVAKLLRAGKTVEAEEYEVRILASDFSSCRLDRYKRCKNLKHKKSIKLMWSYLGEVERASVYN